MTSSGCANSSSPNQSSKTTHGKQVETSKNHCVANAAQGKPDSRGSGRPSIAHGNCAEHKTGFQSGVFDEDRNEPTQHCSVIMAMSVWRIRSPGTIPPIAARSRSSATESHIVIATSAATNRPMAGTHHPSAFAMQVIRRARCRCHHALREAEVPAGCWPSDTGASP
jgi:hypothetical protein